MKNGAKTSVAFIILFCVDYHAPQNDSFLSVFILKMLPLLYIFY